NQPSTASSCPNAGPRHIRATTPIEAVGEESGLPPIAVELARRSNNGLAQQETSGRHFRRHAPAV
ncbi:MAG: hypothetical protein ACLQJ0_20700, partial [Steroidobacteraceae bacterium]